MDEEEEAESQADGDIKPMVQKNNLKNSIIGQPARAPSSKHNEVEVGIQVILRD